MPTYSGFKWNELKISVSPKGVRRVIRGLPYFAGSKVDLTLTVADTSGEQLEFDYEWWYSLVNDNGAPRIIYSTHRERYYYTNQEKASIIMTIPHLSLTSHYIINFRIWYSPDQKLELNWHPDDYPNNFETVADFYAKDKSTFIMQFIGTVAVILVAIFSAISAFS